MYNPNTLIRTDVLFILCLIAKRFFYFCSCPFCLTIPFILRQYGPRFGDKRNFLPSVRVFCFVLYAFSVDSVHQFLWRHYFLLSFIYLFFLSFLSFIFKVVFLFFFSLGLLTSHFILFSLCRFSFNSIISNVLLSLSLSHTHTHTLSLSLSHTHTHTLSLSLSLVSDFIIRPFFNFLFLVVCQFSLLSFFFPGQPPVYNWQAPLPLFALWLTVRFVRILGVFDWGSARVKQQALRGHE